MKQQNKGGFPNTLLGTLGAILSGSLLTDKEFKRWNIPGHGVITADEGIIRAGERGIATSQWRGTIRAG